MTVLSVHILPGCIQCFWCQNLCPQVFLVTDDGCVIRAEARLDQLSNDNRRDRSPLAAGILSVEEHDFMPFLAGGCPVQVISVSETTTAP